MALLHPSHNVLGPRVFALLALAISLSGCGSTKVTDKNESLTPGNSPTMIYVENFDVGAATLQSDPGTLTGRPRLLNFGSTDPATKLQQLSDDLASAIVDDLHKSGLEATRLPAGEPWPKSGWVVSGDFMQVNEGNRLQKTILGFGFGNSETRLVVSVADASRPAGDNLLDFNLESQGNKTPSGAGVAAVTHTPYAMAAKFVLDRGASGKDIKRAAGEIADQLAKMAREVPSR